jgi:hypothetical protein
MRAAVITIAADQHAVLGEQLRQHADVGQVGDVGEAQRAVGQQARAHQRQGGVLGAGDRDRAVERTTAADADLVHGKEPFDRRPRRTIRTAMPESCPGRSWSARIRLCSNCDVHMGNSTS